MKRWSKKHIRYIAIALILIINPAIPTFSQIKHTINVLADKPGGPIQPTMWGVFFEDINFAADGGLYAELVKNRSFEFDQPLMGWKTIKTADTKSKVQLLNYEHDSPNNPRRMRIFSTSSNEVFGFSNEGFRGMGIKENNQYRFSVLAKKIEGESVSIKIELVNSREEKIGEGIVTSIDENWKWHEVVIVSKGTETKAKMNILFSGNGVIEIDMVSLFPLDTWKNRKNGLRADLVELLADLKPGFVRFPGGCIVEGRDLANRYQWKKTVGGIEDRKTNINLWNYDIRNMLTPDYYQSYGLGFFEYFQLAEDLNAEPLPIINCGMACQFRSHEMVPLEHIDIFIQDALDLIEFANGSIDTKWGNLRAEMGHPAPFNLKYLGVGNEQWDEHYIVRNNLFLKAIKEKYPEIIIIGTSGPFADGAMFNYAWKELKKDNVHIIDEHYYQKPEWFLKNASRYDSYDRSGPKVFAGEYAAQSVKTGSKENSNNWLTALSEAAFMTGLERNADVVYMTSYAPLFAHVDAFQWKPDLIWFDNLRSFGTPNYYVQKLFSNNTGTNIIPILLDGKPLTGQDSVYASASMEARSRELILKIVNVSSKNREYCLSLEGVKLSSDNAEVIILTADNLNEYNSLDNPLLVSPRKKISKLKEGLTDFEFTKQSLTIIKIRLE